MAHIEDVLLHSLTQAGDRYVFGAEVPLSASDSDRWDCSELVEWSCARAGVLPRVPDGAYYQWQHCNRHRLNVPVERGISTRGALLFVGDGRGVGRDAITHVAWSLGDGTTIEARGSRWGVGSWPSASRFDFAGLVPGVEYSPRNPLPPEDDDMTQTIVFYDDGTGGNHAYLLTNNIGKYLPTAAAIGLADFLKVPRSNQPAKPLGSDWQQLAVLVDGPLRNVDA